MIISIVNFLSQVILPKARRKMRILIFLFSEEQRNFYNSGTGFSYQVKAQL